MISKRHRILFLLILAAFGAAGQTPSGPGVLAGHGRLC
jgi:hypothetical protein